MQLSNSLVAEPVKIKIFLCFTASSRIGKTISLLKPPITKSALSIVISFSMFAFPCARSVVSSSTTMTSFLPKSPPASLISSTASLTPSLMPMP